MAQTAAPAPEERPGCYVRGWLGCAVLLGLLAATWLLGFWQGQHWR